MTTEKLLRIIASEAFGEPFHSAIKEFHQEAVDRGEMGSTEEECAIAMKNLSHSLSAHKKELLRQYEDMCSKIREFHAAYGFIAGIYCGFRQYYTTDCAPDGGYFTFVAEEIGMMPKMKNHRDNFAHIEHRNLLSQQLKESEKEKITADIICLECTWADRACHASVDAFLCGYYAAVSIMNQIEPSYYHNVKMEMKFQNVDTWFHPAHARNH